MSLPTDYTFESINDFVHNPNAEFEQLQALCLNMVTHFTARGGSHKGVSASRKTRLKWLLKAVRGIGETSTWNLDLIKQYSSIYLLPCRFEGDRICCPSLEEDLHALQLEKWLGCNLKLHKAERGVLIERIYSVPSVTL